MCGHHVYAYEIIVFSHICEIIVYMRYIGVCVVTYMQIQSYCSCTWCMCDNFVIIYMCMCGEYVTTICYNVCYILSVCYSERWINILHKTNRSFRVYIPDSNKYSLYHWTKCLYTRFQQIFIISLNKVFIYQIPTNIHYITERSVYIPDSNKYRIHYITERSVYIPDSNKYRIHYITERSVYIPDSNKYSLYHRTVFGDIMVLALPPHPPVDPDDVNTLNSKNIKWIFFKVYMRVVTPRRYFAIEIWYHPRTRTNCVRSQMTLISPKSYKNAISP